MPDAPRPSADSGIKTTIQSPACDQGAIPLGPELIDIFALTPLASLKLLCASVEWLARIALEEKPPTPPNSLPNTPLSPTAPFGKEQGTDAAKENKRPVEQGSPKDRHHIDIPDPHKTPIGSPEAHPTEPMHSHAPTPHFSIDEASSPHYQRAILARKFYSKTAPPIPLPEYLQRLHTYCPMSTAVYLAAGLYIRRLTRPRNNRASSPCSSSSDEEDFVLPVTSRTAHRLLLAALRVATKALEDQSYAHARFSKVGGVTEKELARLEISFCFLSDFELRVGSQVLTETAVWMRSTLSSVEKLTWNVG